MRRDRLAAGFTLAETLLALGLFAGALLAIGGLTLHSRRLVAAGRAHTVALAVARGIVEDLSAGGFEGTWRLLGLDGSAASARVDSRSCAWAAPWQGTLEHALARARAEIELVALAPAATTPLREASAVRVVVTVSWLERSRPRSLRLVMVRT